MAASTGSSWDVADGPGPLPDHDNVQMWWMTFRLVVFKTLMMLVGITNTGAIAWATYTASAWSRVRVEAAPFSTARRITTAHRGGGILDVLGLSEDGAFVRRTFKVYSDGRVTLLPPP